MYKKIIVERDEEDSRILWIKLNYPQRLNIMHLEMLNELYDALVKADKNDNISAIIITGVGRAFCAGADLNEISKMDLEGGIRWLNAYWRIMELIRDTGKLVIAAINGDCVAGGNELVLMCDLAIAVETARLGQPEIIVGSTAMGSGVQLLPILVGDKRARELLFTARLLSAEEALNWGLINMVVKDIDELYGKARELARKVIDRGSPQAFRFMKSCLKYWTHLAMINWQLARDMTSMTWMTGEFRERAQDFMEKRKMKPRRFTGITP